MKESPIILEDEGIESSLEPGFSHVLDDRYDKWISDQVIWLSAKFKTFEIHGCLTSDRHYGTEYINLHIKSVDDIEYELMYAIGLTGRTLLYNDSPTCLELTDAPEAINVLAEIGSRLNMRLEFSKRN